MPPGIAAFLAVPLIVLLAVSVGTLLLSERLARANALAEAKATVVGTARFLVAPVLLDALNGVPGRWDELDRRVENRLRDGSITGILVWDHNGRVLYSSDHEATGRIVPPSPELTAAVGGKVVADVVSTEEIGDPDPSLRPLVEVYVPLNVSKPDLVLETYLGYERIQRVSSLLRDQIIPVTVGALVLLQVVQVPLGVSLFSRVRRQDAERTELLARTLTASDRERRAIAADVHDGPVQELAGLGYALSALRPAMPARAQAATDRLIASVRDSVAGLRTLMADLYPPDLTGTAMPAALEDHIRRVRSDSFAVHLEATEVPELSSPGAAVLYRTAKEALAVLPGPGAAANAWVSFGPVTLDGAPAALLRVRVDVAPAPEPLSARSADDLEGLNLMRRELVDLGGSLSVTTDVPSGAIVTAVVPVMLPSSGGLSSPQPGVRPGTGGRETVRTAPAAGTETGRWRQ